MGAEAVCHFAENDAGTQGLFGAVVGGRDGAVGEEDEQKASASLDHDLQLAPGSMAGGEAEQRIELGVKLISVGAQRGVGELLPASGDGAGALEQFAQGGREDAVAGVDGVLSLADEVGEADLMIFLGPIHLRCKPVGDPEVRTVGSQEPFDHGAAAVGVDDEAGAVGMMEHPGPPVLLADPHAGLVRLKNGAGEQPGADQARLPGEGLSAVVEHVDEGAFADIKADEIGEQAGQPLERDRVGKAQRPAGWGQTASPVQTLAAAPP